MINDEAKDGHYFAVKNLIKLTSWLRWLRSKKEAIINDNNSLQNALKYNREGIEFPAGSKDWEKSEQNNKTVNYLLVIICTTQYRNNKGCTQIRI